MNNGRVFLKQRLKCNEMQKAFRVKRDAFLNAVRLAVHVSNGALW